MGYIRGTYAFNTKFVYRSYYGSRVLVHKEITKSSAVGIPFVTVRNLCADTLTALSLSLEYRTYFLARISREPFVEQILEWSKLVSILVQGIKLIVDCDISHVVPREYKLGVVSDLNVVSAESG